MGKAFCLRNHAVTLWFIHKVTEAFIQDHPGAGLLTALCQPHQLPFRHGMPRRIVRIAYKNQIGFLRNARAEPICIWKKLFFRQKRFVLRSASAKRKCLLILRKPRGKQECPFGL